MLEEALAVSPQDTFARYALYLLGGEPPSAYVLGRPQDVIDSALDFMNAGLFQEAARVLDTCIQPDQMVYYYYAYCTGNEPKHTDLAYCFPNRLEDIAVLKHFENEWQAQYLLGCIYYDRLHIDAAEEAWERSKSLNPTHAFTHRNLAQLRFDHRNQKNEAVEAMETAQKLAPQNARIIYELLQLYKNTGYTVQQRLKYLEQHQELVKQRDDCYLEQIVLLTQAEQFETAANLLVGKRFNIYEGGEGRLTRHHTWLWTLIGKKAFEEGDYAKAIDSFQKALVYPENYGEGRHYSAQEANVHYYAGCALQQLGKAEEAKAQWQIAVSQPSQITEITYFAALSYQRLGDNTTAKALFSAMKNAGEERCATADLYDYYGVGGRTPLPFELDPIPLNLSEGYMLIALGCLGL